MTQEHSADPTPVASPEQGKSSAAFAQMVLQQTNMALMLLGKVAHPETGETYKDIEGARMFIDQLEMIETKTKGNLTREESGLLKQSLMSLRLSFVEAVESDQGKATAPAAQPGAAAPASAATASTDAAAASVASVAADEEHRKKFSKKY
jgi:hypothetical protein